MLKGDRLILIVLIILTSCTNGVRKNWKSVGYGEDDFLNKTIETSGSKKDYLNLYGQMSDTVSSWYNNNLLPDSSKDESTNYKMSISSYKVDSLFAINSKKDKILGTILHTQDSEAKIWSDEIREFFGAKIHGKWYFWMLASTPIVRESFKGQSKNKALSYRQLHPNALGSIGGYLKFDGSINNEWFEKKFRSGFSKFEDRYMYKYILDGKHIDNEEDYWNYTWKRKGLGLWIYKATQDSISKREKEIRRALNREEKNKIGEIITLDFMKNY